MDAERAHGFRYSQRAYLIQLRRAGPDAPGGSDRVRSAGRSFCARCRGVGDRVGDPRRRSGPPCLYEVGLVPPTLFDTELAALLGYPRVALGTMIEELLEARY